MLEIKPDEFMVGSGDGSVCLIKDASLKSKAGKNRSKALKAGVRPPCHMQPFWAKAQA